MPVVKQVITAFMILTQSHMTTAMKTPISYYGGKQNLVREILPLIPKHARYVEPFFGGGAVFFAKPKSKYEVINDTNQWVVNFYRVCQQRETFEALQQMVQFTPHSESEHRRAKDVLLSASSTDIELAWAFWAQTNLSFGNKLFSGFAFRQNSEANKTANKRKNFTHNIYERLQKVEIFSRDALNVIQLKDANDVFFYVDPPYVSSEQGHYKGYTNSDFQALLDLLPTIEGKFLLSSYPEPSLLEAIGKHGWDSKQIDQPIRVSGNDNAGKRKTEVLTWNYELSQQHLF